MLLAESDGQRLLLTGDGRGDHLLEGLGQAGLLDPEGSLHVDVLKLPHHGSKYNISKEFLQAVTADQYVVSASGRHGHPHKNTLRWIVETASKHGRPIRIVATNTTKSLRDIAQEYEPEEYGYELEVMPEGEHAIVLPVA
jgi:beta-lactamase superfamily II metal-dependent hydrolase